jgi:hypothetical protein
MLAAMANMGMSPEVIKNLTPAQRKAILEMSTNPDVISRAEARVQQSNAASTANNLGFQGRSANGEAVSAPCGKYSWLDEKTTAYVEVPCPTEIGKKEITVTLEKESVYVKVGQDVILDGPLFQHINKAESTWSFTNKGKDQSRVLSINLEKEKPMRWLQVLRN